MVKRVILPLGIGLLVSVILLTGCNKNNESEQINNQLEGTDTINIQEEIINLSEQNVDTLIVENNINIDSQKIEDGFNFLTSNISEISNAMKNSNMSLLYDTSDEINGEDCLVYALGTNSETHFTRENLYALSSTNKVFKYDIISGTWYEIYSK